MAKYLDEAGLRELWAKCKANPSGIRVVKGDGDSLVGYSVWGTGADGADRQLGETIRTGVAAVFRVDADGKATVSVGEDETGYSAIAAITYAFRGDAPFCAYDATHYAELSLVSADAEAMSVKLAGPVDPATGRRHAYTLGVSGGAVTVTYEEEQAVSASRLAACDSGVTADKVAAYDAHLTDTGWTESTTQKGVRWRVVNETLWVDIEIRSSYNVAGLSSTGWSVIDTLPDEAKPKTGSLTSSNNAYFGGVNDKGTVLCSVDNKGQVWVKPVTPDGTCFVCSPVCPM